MTILRIIRKPGLPETIHMRTSSALELFLVVPLEPDLGVHVDSVNQCPSFNEGEIERISVVGRHDGRLGILDMLEPSSYHSCL